MGSRAATAVWCLYDECCVHRDSLRHNSRVTIAESLANLTSDSMYEPPTINVTNGKPAVKNELAPRREAMISVAKPLAAAYLQW